jgi:hypothetical protein
LSFPAKQAHVPILLNDTNLLKPRLIYKALPVSERARFVPLQSPGAGFLNRDNRKPQNF